MDNRFFDRPILNSPYEYPKRHWALDDQGQPTQQIGENRRRAEFITPIPKPRKRKSGKSDQQRIIFDEGKGLSTEQQEYDPTSWINDLRHYVDRWRMIPDPKDWKVTPETARLLQHWRHHSFTDIRPFFCQIEAVEAAIWLTEVAPQSGKGRQGISRSPRESQLGIKSGTSPARSKTGHWRGEDHRYGDADRLADHQCCSAAW